MLLICRSCQLGFLCFHKFGKKTSFPLFKKVANELQMRKKSKWTTKFQLIVCSLEKRHVSCERVKFWSYSLVRDYAKRLSKIRKKGENLCHAIHKRISFPKPCNAVKNFVFVISLATIVSVSS